MRIENRSSNTVSVSINAWESDENIVLDRLTPGENESENQTGGNAISTDWYRLAPGEGDSWSRTDYRGFVMAVSIRGQQNSYFIFADSSIYIYDDYIEDDGKKIKPATDRYS
ncbi:hypothetical protein [Xenorhabdus littoralis]|uniref:hypothetical protein n=1 Tax=Xenorhabdus littoralis TaxID=2582835 RepID=UPI0029E7CE29|nr:hypothetical protein [Xenorhabdus sp. psl]MDX7991711.1 hypothetical protein [Xenorhabdus sp. psl]